MLFDKKNILLISPEPWGINFVSKHHYARELAKNNTVFFLNPPSEKTEITKIDKKLFLIDYKPFLKGINYLPKVFRNKIAIKDIQKIKQFIDQQKIDIVWSFDPYRFQNFKLFGAKISIYHPVDVHKTNLEHQIADSADIVFGSSDIIVNCIRSKTPKFKINHGLSDHFADFKFFHTLPERTIKVGYVGNLLYRFIDKAILEKIIEENKKIEFHFIGPHKSSNLSRVKHESSLIKYLNYKDNCFLHGPVSSEKLPQLLNQFHLLLMSYTGKKNKAELANPHKLLEYLITGKVVVSHYIDEYKDKKHLLEMVESNDHLPEKFVEVISNLEYYNSPEKQAERKAYALENTYEKKIRQIEEIIQTNLKF